MISKKKSKTGERTGVVMPTVLALIFCGFVIVSMLAVHAGRSLILTRRTLDYERATVLAQAGIEFGIMSIKNNISEIGWAKFIGTYKNKINTLVNDKSADVKFKNLMPNYNREYLNGVCFKITDDTMHGTTSKDGIIVIDIYSISKNAESGIGSAIKEQIKMTISQLGDYAAFYEYDLEAWPGENMTFVGKVHSNGDLWIGADKLMKFERNVTAAGNFYAQRKPDSGYGDTAYVSQSGRVQFRKGDDDNYGDTTKPATYADVINTAKNNKRMDYTGIGKNNWYSESMSYYGGAVKTGQSKLSAPISVADDPHAIIERRVEAGQSGYNIDTEAVKFANKACLTIHIDSQGGLHLYDRKHQEIENPESYMQPAAAVSKASTTTGQYNVTKGTYTYTDDNGRGKTEQLPAYQVKNYIYDRREDLAMQPVDIYVDEILNNDKLKTFLYPTNIEEDETAEAGVLYVTRDEPEGYPVVQKVGSEPIYGPITNKITKTSSQLEDGWEKIGTSSVSLYTVKKPSKYYYYTGSGARKTYSYQTTYKGTSYKSSGKTYTYDATKTKNEGGSTNVATGKTQDEANEVMSGHPEYYTVKESGTRTVFNLQKIEVTQGQVGTRDLYQTNYIPTQACVRLRNANNLSLAGSDTNGKRGLSIATDLPLYVEGCFNTDGQKGRSGDDCTTHPSALVAADAVTMLSSNWNDSKRVPWWDKWNANTGPTSLRPDENQNGLNQRVAVETTFNGILMTGIVESNGGTYSGGLQNLFRFHENWRPSSTLPYNFNGSMVCMWISKIAKNPIEGSYTYQPPSRPWGWAKMQPPGLPNIMNIQEYTWERIDANEYPDNF